MSPARASAPVVGCRSCGAGDQRADVCSNCHKPLDGSKTTTAESVYVRPGAHVPDRCCCCLAPASIERRGVIRTRKGDVPFAVPWCGACAARRRTLPALGLAGLTLFVAAVVAGELGDGGTIVSVEAGIFVLCGTAALAALAFLLYVPRRGHARGCNAVRMSSGGDSVVLDFESPAFAAEWRRLNDASDESSR